MRCGQAWVTTEKRFLLEGAKKIVEGGGEFPKTASSLHTINGIGRYAAGAIASIAFGEAVPVVDGNVVRVISSLNAISENPKRSKIVQTFWKLAKQSVDPLRPGDFNQGVMELGATVCTPKSHSCAKCPISHQCRALSLSMMHESVQVVDYPLKVEILAYLSMSGHLGWLLHAIVSSWLLAVLVPIVGIGVFLWWAGRDVVRGNCPNCGNEFQVFKSMLNEDVQLCPFCSQPFLVEGNEFIKDSVKSSNQPTRYDPRFDNFSFRRNKGKNPSVPVVDIEAEVRDVE